MGERYLVIVGRPYYSRVRTTVAVFAGAEEAYRELARVRERLRTTGGWAELASIDDDGRLTPLCRFGAHPVAAEDSTSHAATVGIDRMRTCT